MESPCRRGVECTLAVIGTGGPVRCSNSIWNHLVDIVDGRVEGGRFHGQVDHVLLDVLPEDELLKRHIHRFRFEHACYSLHREAVPYPQCSASHRE
eukprot:8038528-Pyramimonas_sp.AAC.1